MAYKTGIEVFVKGAEQVARMRKRIEDLQKVIDRVGNLNGGSLDVYNQQLETTSRILNKVSQGTALETKAIKLQARALINANDARARTNSLVDKQITLQRALNQTEAEFVQRTQASARAAAAKTAEFIRQQRIAKQVAAARAVAPPPQLLLAPGAPGGPAMSGGARRPVTGPTERLGGLRTQDQADMALRFAQALKEQIRPLSQISALFAGITGEANRLARVKALPSAEMLNASVRGLQRLENAEERRNRELKESADRLKEIDRLERSRARRAKKLQDRAEYFADRRARAGGGSAAPKSRTGRTGLERLGDFGLGAGFPLLFGGGAGQVLGGGLGTIVGGGGPTSFGLQIAFSAIGGQIEAALGRIREMDSALKALDMDALAESAITVNAELRQSVQNLVDMGANQQAVELAANAVLQQTGVLPESVSDASNAVTLLSNVWDEVVGAVSGLLSLVGTPLLSALTLVLKVVGQAVKGINIFVSTVGVGIKRLVQLIKLIPGGDGLLKAIENATQGVNESSEERLATLVKSGEQLDKEFRREQEIFGIEKRRVAGNTAAAKLTNAQATRDEALLKLKNATEDKLIAKRREFQGLTTKAAEIELFFQEQRIKGEAEIQKNRILQKFTIDEQNAALLRQKEIEKERKDLARELFEARVNESKIAQSGVQTQLNQLANDQKIFDLRQQTANVSLQLERAIFDAQLSTLQLEESRLQRELRRLEQKEIRFGRQKDLINAIAKNQARQAKIKFNIDKLEIAQGVAKAQIAQQQVQFEVQRIKLQIQLLKLKAEEIKDDKRRAAKFREIAATERQSNRLTQAMLQSAAQQLRFAVQIARQKGIIARNTLKGKLESIEAERVEKRRAVNAASLAKSTERIANASGSSGRGSGSSDLRPGQSLNSLGRPIILGEKSSSTVTTRLPIDDDVYEAVRRNIRTRDPQRYALELTAALDRAQAAKNARLAADERRRSELSAASYNYSQSRGLTGLSHNETTMVNVTTGPVLEFDGTTYVKMSEFREGLSTVARLTTRSSRYPGNRRFTGIR